MKACHLIPHPSIVPANTKASISQKHAACIRDRDLGIWLRWYKTKNEMNREVQGKIALNKSLRG